MSDVALGINARIAENEELAKGHKMKKHQVNGQPYFTCQKCGYGTELEWQSVQHEAQPI